MKTKQNDKNVHSPHNNILENYIRYITVNNDPLKVTKDDDDDDYEYIFDGEVNLSPDARIQTDALLVDASATSIYVPVPALSISDNDFAELLDQWIAQG